MEQKQRNLLTGNKKSVFLRYFESKFSNAFGSLPVSDKITYYGVADFLTFIRSFNVVQNVVDNVPRDTEDIPKEVMNGRQLITRLCADIRAQMEVCHVLVLNTDKHSPVTKGVEQGKRNLVEKDIPPPLGPTLHPMNNNEIKYEQRRQAAIQRVERLKLQESETLKREKLFSLDQQVPLPFDLFMGSAYRKKVLPLIFAILMDDRHMALCPAKGKKIILDSSFMLPADYPERIKKDFSSSYQGKLEPDMVKKILTTPVSLSHPFEGQEQGNPTACDIAVDSRSLCVDENGEMCVQKPKVSVELDYSNNIGEFDATFPFYIALNVAKGKEFNFLITSTDSDTVLNALWMLYRMKRMPESFDLVYRDGFVGMSDEEALKKNEEYINGLKNNTKKVNIWVNYGISAARISMNKCVDVVKLYDMLADSLKPVGGEHGIPSLITAIVTCNSDYTVPYSNVGMKSFIDAYLNHCGKIGALVHFTKGTYPLPMIHASNYISFLCAVFIRQYIRTLVPKKRKRASKGAQKKSKLEGGLVNITSSSSDVCNGEGEEEEEEEGEEKVIERCLESYNLNSLREELNPKLLTAKCKRIITDPMLFPNMGILEYNNFRTYVSKRIPCIEEIKQRTSLVQAMVLYINGYGDAHIEFPDPELHGYEKKNNSQPISARNIKTKANRDWEKWDEVYSFAKLAIDNISNVEIQKRWRAFINQYKPDYVGMKPNKI